MSKKLLLIGGGGHCKSVLDTLIEQNIFDEVGIIDNVQNIGKKVLNVPIIGEDDDLGDLYKKGYKNAFLTLGSIGNVDLRFKLYEVLYGIGFEIPIIIDSSAIVSKTANIKKGVFVGKNAIVNAGTTINENSIINSGAIVEHDCDIGSFVHVATGAVICGDVKIGKNSHIGANSVVKQSISIGENVMIGMGSVVTSNKKDGIIAFGNPCLEK